MHRFARQPSGARLVEQGDSTQASTTEPVAPLIGIAYEYIQTTSFAMNLPVACGLLPATTMKSFTEVFNDWKTAGPAFFLRRTAWEIGIIVRLSCMLAGETFLRQSVSCYTVGQN
jgi:hypothetical protein